TSTGVAVWASASEQRIRPTGRSASGGMERHPRSCGEQYESIQSAWETHSTRTDQEPLYFSRYQAVQDSQGIVTEVMPIFFHQAARCGEGMLQSSFDFF
ncbi:MAG: hypothetical protein P9D89_09555, partial [Candidatus Contendobacter sp.]|nr:hypothetical protein [Candidatus Contendobacter sp.]